MFDTVVVVILSLLLAALLGGAGWILMKRIRSWVAVWNQVLEPLGGVARPYLRLRSVLQGRLALDSDVVLTMEQWKGGGSIGHGQIVATLSFPKESVSPFYFGNDAWAAAFARWGLRLPGFGTSLEPPLDRGRAEDPEAASRVVSLAVASGLRALGVYFICGRMRTIEIYVPGVVEEPVHRPRLQAIVNTAREVAEAVSTA